jgi:hypothetical protein
MTVKVRHCERSEAISWTRASKLEIAASLTLLAKTHESVLPRLVTAQRDEVLAMTTVGIASSLSLLAMTMGFCYGGV